MKLNANVFSVITLLLCLASQPTHADSILATLNYWTAGTTTGNQASNASFKGGATADGGKSFATTFTAEQKIAVLTYLRVATDHVGKTGGLYVVAHYNNAWFMKVSDSQWKTWNNQLANLVSFTGPRSLEALEGLKVAEQLSGLVGSFEVYVGYTIDGDIHYNAKPFSFTVKEKPAPVVPVNVTPIADAGVDKDLNELTQVTLDGSLSRDPDGSIVKYLWEQTNGTTAKLDNPASAKLTFTAPEVTRATDLNFKLTVTDNQGATASDTVTVIVRDVSIVYDYVPNPTCSLQQVLQGNQCVTPTPTCTPPQVLQGYQCVTPTPTCTPPQVLQGNQCVTPPPTCTPPQVLQGYQCVTPTPTCTPPQVLQGYQCVTPTPTCTPPQVLQGNQCVTPTPTCTPPQVLQGNQCVTPTPTCTPPQVLQGNQCVTPTPTCTPPQVLQGNQCVTPTPTCTPPQVLQGNQCVTPTPTCTPPQVLQGNQCVTPTPTCTPPQVLQGNQCVTPTPTCTPPQVLQGNQCVTPTPTCTPPQVLQGNQCITPTPTCTPPQVLQGNQCITPTPTCTPPQVLQGNQCVTPTPTCTPPQVLQNNVCALPAVSNNLADTSAFLYTGSNPIQTGVTPSTVEVKRAAVIRGKVFDKANNPLPGVTITIKDHPEFGQTLSQNNGQFDMAVNGGGLLTINYQKTGYLPVQRQVTAPWQDYVIADDVVMIVLDSRVTTVDLASAEPMQVAQGNPVSDQDGQRQATLMIPQGTKAQVYNPDGSLREVSTLTLRMTEYTVGENGLAAMPGPLPPTSAYTYALEFRAEEAATKIDGKDVIFNQPVPFYVDNFLGMPVGIQVPVAYWNKDKNAWIPSEDGKVIKVLSVTGGLADIDADGDGSADNAAQRAASGLSDAERSKLSAYPVGKSLWRVVLTHLSTYDLNYGIVPASGATQPNQPAAQDGDKTKPDDPCIKKASVIECENQTLGEVLPLVGTNFSLHYASDRVPGRKTGNMLNISLSGTTIPSVLKRIDLEVEYAGRTFEQSFPAQPNQNYTFNWDGLDAYGRTVQGGAAAKVRIGYAYNNYYALPPAVASSFGASSGQRIPGNIPARTELINWQTQQYRLGNGFQNTSAGLGGWTFGLHHAYDPTGKILYMGNGRRRSISGTIALNNIIETVVGTGEGGYSGDGGPATQAKIWGPESIALASDGSMLIADFINYRIRKVAPDGTISTLIGTGERGYSGDGGPATQAKILSPTDVAIAPDGSILMADGESFRIRRIATDGTINTLAGTGQAGYSGDGGLATQALLNYTHNVAVTHDGSVLIADMGNHCIRKVAPDGQISSFAGRCGVVNNGGTGDDGGPASQAWLLSPYGLTIALDGSVLIADMGDQRIRRVDPFGTISTFAGTGGGGLTIAFGGDGGSALQAQLWAPHSVAVAPDGSVLIADTNNHRIRRVAPDGIITTLAGSSAFKTNGGYSGDGGLAAQAMLRSPHGVTVAPDGSVLVADYGNARVRRIRPTFPGVGIVDILIPSEDGTEIYHFDATGRHLRTLNAITKAVLYNFQYTAQGLLSQITDASGNVTHIERDALGKPTAIVAPFGQRTQLALDSNGFLKSVLNPAGDTFAMDYKADGLLTQFKDPRSNISTMSYDALGRLLLDQNAAGGSQNLARTELPLGYQVDRTTGAGRKTTHTVENLAIGDLKRTVTSPDGVTGQTLEKPDGTTISSAADGSITTLLQGPDPRFSMLSPLPASVVVQSGGLTSTMSSQRTLELFDPNDILSLKKQTDTLTLNGRTSTRVYDAGTKTATATSAAGRVSSTTIDAIGRPVQTQLTGILPLNSTYDTVGHLTSLTQGSGGEQRITSFSYNVAGFLATVTDSLGRQVTFEYDLAGRVTKQTLPNGQAVLYSYDATGNLIALTPPGQPAHLFNYTSINQTGEYIPPVVAAGGNNTVYQYDIDKALSKITRPDGLTLNFSRDSAGRLSKQTVPEGDTDYAYDPTTGKLDSITVPDGGKLSFSYNGSLLTQTALTGSVAGNIGYAYDNDFRVNSISVNGANSIAYSYDDDSLLTQVGSLNLTRNPQNGLLSATSLGLVSDILSYNGFGESSSYEAIVNSASLLKIDYTRDQLGRITRKVETQNSASNTYDYSYDSAGRLQEVKLNNVTTSLYSYDSNGNRLSRTQGATITTGVYDAQDRLLSYGGASFTYTDNGELKTRTVAGLVTSYLYDVLSNLRKVTLADGRVVEYVIDGQNRRIGKKINGTLVQGFLWQDQLKPIAELDGSGAIVSRFVYATHQNVPDFLLKGGVTYRIITDHLGSPRFVVNTADGSVAQQMQYDEFGQVISDSNPGFQPFGFAGGVYDRDTGLVRFGVRDYEAVVGRWISKDPIGLDGGLNMYEYVIGNPLGGIDLTGLDMRIYDDSDHLSFQLDTTKGVTSFGFGPRYGLLFLFGPGQIDQGETGYARTKGRKLIDTYILSEHQGDQLAKRLEIMAVEPTVFSVPFSNCRQFVCEIVSSFPSKPSKKSCMNPFVTPDHQVTDFFKGAI